MFDEISGGKNSYMKMERIQSSSFDTTWIEQIEGVIMDLGDIVSNPKISTKEITEVVPVELARKVGAVTVQHLASHSKFVKNIDEDGNIVPDKLLHILHDDEIKTYENRFIATFIRKLVLFVEKRYEFISHFAALYDEEVLYFKNESSVDGKQVEVETKVKVKTIKDDDMVLKTNSYLERIKQVRDYILYYYNSNFMKQFRTDRDVRKPILQTNIIRKNVKYRHCFEVFCFIDKYDSLGVNYKVDENYTIFDQEEVNEVNTALLVDYLAVKSKLESHATKKVSRTYKPKVLTSLDDESFIYGPLLEGPISFVRTDEEYRRYHLSKVNKEIPIHPTKKEREFYLNEYSVKREFKADEIETDNLLKRVQKQREQYEAEVQRIIEEREAEERAYQELLEKERREAEEAMLNKVREGVVQTALSDFTTNMNTIIMERAHIDMNAIDYSTHESGIGVASSLEGIPAGEIEKSYCASLTQFGFEEEKEEEEDHSAEENMKAKMGPYDYDDGSGDKFIVRMWQGYYVDETHVTRQKHEAKIFRSQKAIDKFKKKHSGRVIKL